MKSDLRLIQETLAFWGPLNINQIVAKLGMTKTPLSKERVEAAVNVGSDGLGTYVKLATGFNEPTYKVCYLGA
jgi:hypothetical protein